MAATGSRPPLQDLDYGEAPLFLEREAAKRGFPISGYPGSFELDNRNGVHKSLDDDAIAATDDIIRRFPQSEFIEAGVKLQKRGWFGGGYNYSKGIAGGPTEIPPNQWDKLRSINPLDKTVTTLHFHGAVGPQSLKPSNKGGDLSYARKHFGDAGQYIFNWQDGKLRYFDSQGRGGGLFVSIPIGGHAKCVLARQRRCVEMLSHWVRKA